MELNQIRYFILTAQTQNMSKAARALHITQPTLSKSISNLETELGNRLFDRYGKRLILNEKGSRFLEKVIGAVQELDSAAEQARDKTQKPSLRLGLLHINNDFMRCINDFSLMYPDIRLQIDHVMEFYDSIDTNQFDMLLYPRGSHFHKYKGQPLFIDSYMLAFNKTNQLSKMSIISLADIRSQNLIFIKTGKSTYDFPYYVCRSSGLVPESKIVTNSREIQLQLISNGCGVGFVSEGCLDFYKKGDNIAIRPIMGEDMQQEIMIGFKRRKHLSESGLLLIEHILRIYGKTPASDKSEAES